MQVRAINSTDRQGGEGERRSQGLLFFFLLESDFDIVFLGDFGLWLIDWLIGSLMNVLLISTVL